MFTAALVPKFAGSMVTELPLMVTEEEATSMVWVITPFSLTSILPAHFCTASLNVRTRFAFVAIFVALSAGE